MLGRGGPGSVGPSSATLPPRPRPHLTPQPWGFLSQTQWTVGVIKHGGSCSAQVHRRQAHAVGTSTGP